MLVLARAGRWRGLILVRILILIFAGILLFLLILLLLFFILFRIVLIRLFLVAKESQYSLQLRIVREFSQPFLDLGFGGVFLPKNVFLRPPIRIIGSSFREQLRAAAETG